ncbi:MAG TPA: Rrf2 family transcriptional regulator, partial [Bacillota bacterium]|nr:Rrf2 family transcriptional regulator [Bacillota bacterium]
GPSEAAVGGAADVVADDPHALGRQAAQHRVDVAVPDLRRAGLIESVRGARGGYLLARPPSEIKVGDIVRAVEGPIAPVSCLLEPPAGRSSCHRSSAGCLTRHVWEKLRDRINEVLDEVYLADLIDIKPAQLIN